MKAYICRLVFIPVLIQSCNPSLVFAMTESESRESFGIAGAAIPILLFLLGFYFYRRSYMKFGLPAHRSQAELRCIGALPLGGYGNLMMVEFDQKKLLIASSASGVVLLSESSKMTGDCAKTASEEQVRQAPFIDEPFVLHKANLTR